VSEPSSASRAAVCDQRSLSVEQYERFAPLVRRAAMRFARQVSSSVEVSDIIGSGLVGLVDAVKRADPGAPQEQIDQYIWYRVRAAMLEYVRSFDARTRNLQAVSRRLTLAIKIQSKALGRAPAEAEIAAAMELEIPAYRRTLTALAGAGMTQLVDVDLDLDLAHDLDLDLDLELAHDLDAAPAELLVQDRAPAPRAQPAATVDALAKAVHELPLLLQQILALQHQEDCTPGEIAEVLDLTEARVVQLHIEAIHRLRAGIGRS
jgi:RNA polymerase sigma factor for flagellar operon FliA